MKQESKIAQEIEKMPYEPLLPIEKKLIGWSVAVDKFGKVTKVYPHGPKITREDPSLSPGDIHRRDADRTGRRG